MDLVILTYGVQDDAPEIEGKFLQLRLNGVEHLVFVPRELDRFHNQILARVLADRRIAHHWNDPQQLEFDRASVKIIGGGRFRLQRHSQTLALWDNSQAYGRFDARGLAEKIAASKSFLSKFSITIDE